MISKEWRGEQKHASAGIRFQVQYRRDEQGGNLGRITLWDGAESGRVLHVGTYDAVRSLYREMVRTAASVGPWT